MSDPTVGRRPIPQRPLFTLEEATQYVPFRLRTLRRWCLERRIPGCRRTPGRYWVTRDWILNPVVSPVPLLPTDEALRETGAGPLETSARPLARQA